jgi:hypothetical protein
MGVNWTIVLSVAAFSAIFAPVALKYIGNSHERKCNLRKEECVARFTTIEKDALLLKQQFDQIDNKLNVIQESQTALDEKLNKVLMVLARAGIAAAVSGRVED